MSQCSLLPVFFLFAFTSFVQAATLRSLNNYQIVHTFQNTTITSVPLAEINDQLIANPFTGYLGQSGRVVGYFAKPLTNDQPQTDWGVWTVTSDGTFCITWNHWNNHQQVCWFIYELGNGYLFVNAKGHDFASVILKNIKPGNHTGKPIDSDAVKSNHR